MLDKDWLKLCPKVSCLSLERFIKELAIGLLNCIPKVIAVKFVNYNNELSNN